MADITQILQVIEGGDLAAAERLLPTVYSELRCLARSRMALESPDHTLQATALVHEAYLRLVRDDRGQQWNSRGHFFSAASEAMRRILVESARGKSTKKRGGTLRRQQADLDHLPEPAEPIDILAADEAIERLASEEPQIAKFVELRYFAGLNAHEAAAAIGVSGRTARRYWAYAKAWLRHELSVDRGE